MNKIFKYLSQQAIKEIRIAITNANGNEVFLVGKTNTKKIVETVTVLARGNEFAVPVVKRYAEQSDVVIHNHPTGDLNPSENDLYVSSVLGDIGIGSYIVDNKVNNIYVILEPFDRQETKFLDEKRIARNLEPNGCIAKKLKGYEFRPQQLQMVKQVCNAFNNDKIAIIEAGTGVGKTLAYLLPAIYWAVNNNERCIVSTNTINLQEQLIKKDIPFLQSALDLDFKAVLIKGRSNYVCLNKIAELEQEPELMIETDEQEEIKTLIEWAKRSKDGSKSDLSFIPKEQIWEKIAAESDTCMRVKCNFFNKCFVNNARRKANKAHILVVNHHLLFADLAVRASDAEVAVLPPYKRLIFDEAHHIEDVATSYFGAGITRIGIARILGRLYRKKNIAITGYLPLLAVKVHKVKMEIEDEKLDQVISQINQNLIPQINLLITLNNDAMDSVFSFIYATTKDEFGEIKQRITPRLKEHPLWDSQVNEKTSKLLYQLKKFCSDLSSTISLLESCDILFSNDMSTLIFQIQAQRERLLAARNVVEKVLFDENEQNVQWVEIKPRSSGNVIRLKISPLDIAKEMYQTVFKKFDTIIMTSATLAVTGIKGWDEFDYIGTRIGLNLVDATRKETALLSSPFDYRQQAIIGIPLDIPAPNDPDFSEMLAKLILRSVTISKGRAFILFTSYGLLNLLHSRLEESLTELGIATLKQGSVNRHKLLEKFKQNKKSVLYATDSFWEGVDVPGQALESVIITKLPFKVPTEPIIEARIEAIQKRGGNAFMEYSVPQATIKLKQGLGRLIRSKSDHGSILIFDKRIIEKFYGKVFIASLPNSEIIKGPQKQVFEKIESFFENSH